MTAISTEVAFTSREVEVLELLVTGRSGKYIAGRLGLAVGTVHVTIRNAAGRLPGGGRPSYRITRWYYLQGGSTEALRTNGAH